MRLLNREAVLHAFASSGGAEDEREALVAVTRPQLGITFP